MLWVTWLEQVDFEYPLELLHEVAVHPLINMILWQQLAPLLLNVVHIARMDGIKVNEE